MARKPGAYRVGNFEAGYTKDKRYIQWAYREPNGRLHNGYKATLEEAIQEAERCGYTRTGVEGDLLWP